MDINTNRISSSETNTYLKMVLPTGSGLHSHLHWDYQTPQIKLVKLFLW